MSAFKFHRKNSISMITDTTHRRDYFVDIFMLDGSTRSLRWLGFKTKPELVNPPFGVSDFVKMAAISVSAGTGLAGSSWRVLMPGEFVASWMVFYDATYRGVYTIVDRYGCPVVLGNKPLSCAA